MAFFALPWPSLAKILTFVPPTSTARMRLGANGFRFFIVVFFLVVIGMSVVEIDTMKGRFRLVLVAFTNQYEGDQR
ncbi:MAG: hypothetical protein H0T87_09500 [Gammaproteobacteria bacterium]|nr:hypothetical protein [Gammaproteobacteria bacterium]